MGGAITPVDFFTQFNTLINAAGIGLYPFRIDFTAVPPKIDYVWRSEYALVPGSILTIPRVLTSGNEAELIPFLPLGNPMVKQLPTVVSAYRELDKIIESKNEHIRRPRRSFDVGSKMAKLLAGAEADRKTENGAYLRFELGLYSLIRSGTTSLKTAAGHFFHAANIYEGLGLYFKAAMLAEIGALANRYMIEEGDTFSIVDNHLAPSANWVQAIKRPIGQVENTVPIFLGLAHSIVLRDWETARRALEASIEYSLSNNFPLPLDDRIRLAWAVLGGDQHIDEKTNLITQDDWKLSSKIMMSVADGWAKRNQHVAQIPDLRALAEQAAQIGEVWKDSGN